MAEGAPTGDCLSAAPTKPEDSATIAIAAMSVAAISRQAVMSALSVTGTSLRVA